MAAMDEVTSRAVLHEAKLGAVALGLCIARTFGERDPTIQQRLADRADRMHRDLCEQGKGHAGEIVAAFALALERPDDFPLFKYTTNDRTPTAAEDRKE